MLTIVAYALLFGFSLAFAWWGFGLLTDIVRGIPEVIIGLVFLFISFVLCWKYYDLLWNSDVYVASWVGAGSVIVHIAAYCGMLSDRLEQQKPDKA